MFWFLVPAVLAVATIATPTVLVLCYECIKDILEEYIKNNGLKANAAVISKKFKEGVYNVVNVNLIDRNGNTVETLNIKSEVDQDDYYVGQTIELKC